MLLIIAIVPAFLMLYSLLPTARLLDVRARIKPGERRRDIFTLEKNNRVGPAGMQAKQNDIVINILTTPLALLKVQPGRARDSHHLMPVGTPQQF
jgi:hypothetical protein